MFRWIRGNRNIIHERLGVLAARCTNNGLEAQGGNMEFEESEESSQMMEEEMNENHSQSDFRELVVQMRRANLCFQQMCSVPMG